jgi:hypothetical protein
VTASEISGSLSRFRRTTWRYQRTFLTRPKDRGTFAAAIVSAQESMETAFVVIDEVIFEPRRLGLLLAKHLLPSVQLVRDSVLTANNREEITELLEASLTDGINFAFVPTPKPFVIYADHDEYTTLFANTKSNLNVSPLLKSEFKEIQNYERHL